jgi:hypothetical protein
MKARLGRLSGRFFSLVYNRAKRRWGRMDFSKLPTDNLYKFMALFGVAFVLFSFYFVHTQIYKFVDKVLEASLEKEILTVEIKQAEELADDLRKLQNPTKEESKELKEIVHDIERRKVLLQEKERMLAVWNKKIKSTFLYGDVLVVFGFIFIFLGFPLWYFRVQRYQDMAIQSNMKQ